MRVTSITSFGLERRQQRRQPLKRPGSCRRPAGRSAAGCARRRRRSRGSGGGRDGRADRRDRGSSARDQVSGGSAGGTGSIPPVRQLAQTADVVHRAPPRGPRPARPGSRPPAPPRRRACPSSRAALGHRQRAGNRADRPVERELAGQRVTIEHAARAAGRWPPAAPPRSPGRSPVPALRRSAGARLAVIRCCGYSKPELTSAERTRSRDSRTAASGRPTIVKDGQARLRCRPRRGRARPRPRSARRCGRARTWRRRYAGGAPAWRTEVTLPSPNRCDPTRAGGSREPSASRR